MNEIRLKHFLGAFALVCGVGVSIASAQGWRGIRPFESTRQDFEALLGKCKKERVSSCLYETPSENIHFVFNSRGGCDGVFNVESGVVVSVAVFPQRRLRVEEAGFRLSDFVISQDSELPAIREFLNKKDGIAIEIDSGFVSGIYFGPTIETAQRKSCSIKAPTQR